MTTLKESIHESESTDTTVSRLDTLSNSKYEEVRSCVANNVHTSMEALIRLARDVEDNLKYDMAENTHIPVKVLEILTIDNNPYIVNRAQQTLARIFLTNNKTRMIA